MRAEASSFHLRIGVCYSAAPTVYKRFFSSCLLIMQHRSMIILLCVSKSNFFLNVRSVDPSSVFLRQMSLHKSLKIQMTLLKLSL